MIHFLFQTTSDHLFVNSVDTCIYVQCKIQDISGQHEKYIQENIPIDAKLKATGTVVKV